MMYSIQVHFINGGRFEFEYEPDEDEHINDFVLRFDAPNEKFMLTGDERTTALIAMDQISAVIAIPVSELPINKYPTKVLPFPGETDAPHQI